LLAFPSIWTFAILLKDLLTSSIFWFGPAIWWRVVNTYLYPCNHTYRVTYIYIIHLYLGHNFILLIKSHSAYGIGETILSNYTNIIQKMFTYTCVSSVRLSLTFTEIMFLSSIILTATTLKLQEK
jgi:hypothetical protein